MFTMPWIVRLAGACAAAALAGLILTDAASAQTTLRLGKAQANQFAFIPADIGVETGIFKKHGIDLDIAAFAGDVKMVQALTANSLDIALGGSPSFSAIVKGAPMKAVAVFSGAPNIIMLTVLKDGPFKTVDDIKGHTVSVSGAGSLTFWLTQQLSRRLGWGDDGIKITPLGASEAQIAALDDPSDRRHHDGQRHGREIRRIRQRPHPGEIRRLFSGFHHELHLCEQRLIESNPAALKAFLAGWFETIAYMRDHRPAVLDTTIKLIGMSPGVASAIYDDTMPTMSLDGRFNPKALDLLADSFVAMKLLPSKPDMAALLTEAYLPK